MTLRLSSRDQRHLRVASKVLLSPDSTATEEEWHLSVMHAFMPLVRSHHAAIRNSEGGDFRMTRIGFEDSALREYRDYYNRFDYGRALGGPQVYGHVFSRNYYYGNRLPDFRRTEYFADFLVRYRVLDAMCLSTRNRGHDRGSVMYFWYDDDLSEIERRRAVAILRLMIPVFRSGMAMRAGLRGRHGQLFSTLDSCSDACALFTHRGALLHRNPAMTALLSTCSNPGGLTSTIENQVSHVRALFFSRGRIVEPIARSSCDFRDHNGMLRVSTCTLEVVHAGTNPSILVTVARLGAPAGVSPDVEKLQSRFRLTRREAQVATLLCARMTNEEIAFKLGVSEHTARHHTENVMAKLKISHRRDVLAAVSDHQEANPPQ